MSRELHPPLAAPKNGHTYEILAVARVSDPTPGKQDERSLGDQETSYRAFLDGNTKLPYTLTVIAGSGSGELLDRVEIQRLTDAVATGRYDLVLCEDLGRIVRRIHAHLMCEHCEDHRTRLYAKNDHVDTALPNWREASIFAAFHHERSNRDTSERIKRTHRSRFMGGCCLPRRVYGWIKPPGAKSDADLRKDPDAEPVYREWFRMLNEDDNASFADVARWLNSIGVPVTPWKRARGEWDGKMVARHTYNVLLKGLRERNRRKTRRINNPGKYVSEKADPADLLQRRVPHLAFFDEAYYDRVVAKLKARNGAYRRSDDPAHDPCLHRPKRKTRCPGGVTFCGVCGRPFVWGGHGQTDRLMCAGAREHRCWNGATFDGPEAARRITGAVLAQVESLPDFDPAFLQMVHDEARRLDADREKRIDDGRRNLLAVEKEIANVVRFIRTADADGGSAALAEELRRLEQRKAVLKAELTCEERSPVNTVEIPALDEIKGLAREALRDAASSDGVEFARTFRKLVPRLVVFPYRLCDGGRVVLRAKFRLRLASLVPERRVAAALRGPLERVVTVDLFDPPQREAVRRRVLAARAAGRTERRAASDCGVTVTAAQAAAALQRAMDERGLADDAYVPVLQPPDDLPKLRRHKAKGYRFEPVPGAGEL